MKKAKIVVVLALAVLLVFSSIAVSFAQEGDAQVVPTATVSSEPTKSIDPQPTETADPQATTSVDPQSSATVSPNPTETALAGLMAEENVIAEPTEAADAVPIEEAFAPEDTAVAAAANNTPTVTVTANGESLNSSEAYSTRFYVLPNSKVEVTVTPQVGGGGLTYEWTYSSFDRTVVDKVVSNQPVLAIDPITVAAYGRYSYKVVDGTGRIQQACSDITLAPDMQYKISINQPEIVAGKPVVITGEASYKKIGSAACDGLELYFTGLAEEYVISLNQGVSMGYGGWSIADLEEVSGGVNGVVREEKTVLVDNETDYKIAFQITLQSAPLVWLGERTGTDGVRQAMLYTFSFGGWLGVGTSFDGGYEFPASYASAKLDLPETHNINSNAGESTSKDNAVKIQGDFPLGTEVSIGDVSDTGIVSAMQSALKSGEQFVWLKDISLEVAGQHLDFNGELTVSVWMGEAYNGKTLKILHYKADGQVEELSGTVEDGDLTFKTTGLSPFGVVADGATAGGTTKSPKTGDGSLPLALLVVIAVGAAGSIAFVAKRQKQHNA